MFSSAAHYKHIVSAAMASEDESLSQGGMQMLQNYTDESKEMAGPSNASTSDRQNTALNLLQLPQELQHNILRYLSYAELSRVRMTCHSLKQACGCVLNQGFQKIQARIQKRFQHIKSQMPRRESARRKHPLARECDIMETLHMRMALLHMTFGRRIERGHCCFFAGEVLDEVLRILDYVTNTTNIGRAYKVTDELFDLSTMAMEYFKEKIEPTFPEINTLSPDYIPIFSTPKARPFLEALKPANETDPQKSSNTPSTSSPVLSPPVSAVSNRKIKTMTHDLRKLRRNVSVYMRKTNIQRSQLRDSTSKLEQQDRKIEEQNRRIEALITELHQCQSDIRQLQTPCKDPATLASQRSPLSTKPTPKATKNLALLPTVSSSCSGAAQKVDATADNSPQKRPLSPSSEEAGSSSNGKKRKVSSISLPSNCDA